MSEQENSNKETSREAEIDWTLYSETVESLHRWINELSAENHGLKEALHEIARRLGPEDERIRDVMQGINVPELD